MQRGFRRIVADHAKNIADTENIESLNNRQKAPPSPPPPFFCCEDWRTQTVQLRCIYHNIIRYGLAAKSLYLLTLDPGTDYRVCVVYSVV